MASAEEDRQWFIDILLRTMQTVDGERVTRELLESWPLEKLQATAKALADDALGRQLIDPDEDEEN